MSCLVALKVKADCVSYNDVVKNALATRQAEVVEMYQPMTDLMRQCQDAITECMEAMLVELKRDHSLVSWRGSSTEFQRADRTRISISRT